MDEAKAIERREAPSRPSATVPPAAADTSRTAASVSRLASIAAEVAAARAAVRAPAAKPDFADERPVARETAPEPAADDPDEVSAPSREEATEADKPISLAERKAAIIMKKAEVALKRAQNAAKRIADNPSSDPEAIRQAEYAIKKAELAWDRAEIRAKELIEGPPVAKAPLAPMPVVLPGLQPALEDAVPAGRRAQKQKKISWAQLSFIAAVLVPVFLIGLYYLFLSSDQYRSEMRFAVRGTERSTLENLGLSAIPGASEQAGDAYIVIDYIHSKQVILDIQQKLGIDLRQFFSRPDIDIAYRIDPNMPLEKFINYWRWMIDASYNSTTSITTFEVTAFNGQDAAAIANAVLKVSGELVNDLSTKARLQLISNAQTEVTRTEDRLIKARQELTAFRNLIGTPDPTLRSVSDQAIIQELEKQLLDRKSRKASLISTTVDTNSPSVRVLDRQIEALTALLDEKRRAQGSSDTETAANQLTQYNSLMLEQEFSEKAYTTALASLETSQAEARRQDRYFAIAVEPNVPEIALHPLRLINTFVAFLALCVIWLIGYLVAQAIRDHTV